MGCPDAQFGLSLLPRVVRFQPQSQKSLGNAKHFMNIRERRRGVVVVVHEPVVVISVGRDLIDHEADFLKRGAAMPRPASRFDRSPL
jgi:hypothetical protein